MLSKSRTILQTTMFGLKSKCPTKIFTRGASDQQKNLRQKLPQYKRILGDLPPLTGLLTSQKVIEDAAKLRSEKLDIYLSYVPVGSNTNLLEAIFKADNVDNLLSVIDANLITMTSFYIGISFEALDDIMRANLCDKATVAVAPEFRRLCSKAIYKMRFLEADEVLKLLKCLSTLKVPENMLIVQATLQMARNHINEFTIKELETLENAIDQFDLIYKGRESLLLALKEAIPLAIDRQIEEKQFSEEPYPIENSSLPSRVGQIATKD